MASGAPGIGDGPADNPEPNGSQDNTAKDAKTLAAEVSAARAHVVAYKVNIVGTTTKGQYSRTEGCMRATDEAMQGTLQMNGVEFDLISTSGFLYMRGDAQAWLATSRANSSQVAAVRGCLPGASGSGTRATAKHRISSSTRTPKASPRVRRRCSTAGTLCR